MTEQTLRPPPLTGDYVSKLVQVIVKQVGLQDFKSTGKGDEDIRSIACRAANADVERNELWKGVVTITQLIDATPDIPEAFKAVIMVAILKARGNAELAKKV
jgi:hypothetical protein